MNKINMLSFYIFFIIPNIVLASDWLDLDIVEKNGLKQREIIGFMETYYIDENNYQKIKNKAEDFKETNYLVYENFAHETNNELTGCDLINFNQNNIKGIYMLRQPKNKNGLYDNLTYKESYVLYGNNQKLNIRDGDFLKCEDIDIKNCNTNGNNGLNCLKQLPEACNFVISSEKGSFCINLKNDKTDLIEYGCDNIGCKKLDHIVEYIYD